MATQLPKEKKNYIIIEPTKVTVALFTVLIGLVGWLGKAMYDKLTSIESDVKTLLVAQSADKTNIDNINKRLDRQDQQQQQPIKNKTAFLMLPEFLLPDDIVSILNEDKKKHT